MEERNIVTGKSVTGKLIGLFFGYGILFGIIYSMIYGRISNNVSSESSLIPIAIIAIILQGIITFLVWRCSITSVFKKVTINKSEVGKVIKNLIIFSVVISIITAVTTWIEMNDNFNERIENSFEINMAERYMQYLYDDEQIAEYNLQKEKIINETKVKLNTYFVVLETGLLIVYVAVVPLQKEHILKYCVE